MDHFRPEPVVNQAYLNQIEDARRFFTEYCQSMPGAPAMMLRFAWIDAATYDAVTKRGGAHASIRSILHLLDEILNPRGRSILMHPGRPYHAVEMASLRCEEVKLRCPDLTYADIIQLAGVVAVQVAGGPTSIEFQPGRRDTLAFPENTIWPARRDVLNSLDAFLRMGVSHKDIVALSGGLSLGRKEQQIWNPVDVSDMRGETTFDNSYFKDLLETERGEPHPYLKPADRVLLFYPVLRYHVKLYARRKDAFFKDYAEAHKKFSELGFTPKKSITKTKKSITKLAQRYLPAAATTALVVLYYFFQSRRRVN